MLSLGSVRLPELEKLTCLRVDGRCQADGVCVYTPMVHASLGCMRTTLIGDGLAITKSGLHFFAGEEGGDTQKISSRFSTAGRYTSCLYKDPFTGVDKTSYKKATFAKQKAMAYGGVRIQ